MKGKRREAREDAVQILYQFDLNPNLTVVTAIEAFKKSFSQEKNTIDPFTEKLVKGVLENLPEIDKRIEDASKNWRTNRMPAVDRNILRIGTYELCFCDDIPVSVSLNEMVEIAKAFGSENSPAFVNGVLDKVQALFPSPSKVT
jgi:transcription antitermination protein NusB